MNVIDTSSFNGSGLTFHRINRGDERSPREFHTLAAHLEQFPEDESTLGNMIGWALRCGLIPESEPVLVAPDDTDFGWKVVVPDSGEWAIVRDPRAVEAPF